MSRTRSADEEGDECCVDSKGGYCSVWVALDCYCSTVAVIAVVAVDDFVVAATVVVVYVAVVVVFVAVVASVVVVIVAVDDSFVVGDFVAVFVGVAI